MSVEREMVDAYRAGIASWDALEQPVENPWRGDAETARERVLARAWRAGRHDGLPPIYRDAAEQ